jgi:23S rRNA (guanosine2251-2'-O)-methyltransferase
MEWIYGRQVVRLAALPGARRAVRRIAGTAPALRDLGLDPQRSRVPVEVLPAQALDDLTGSHDHQGIAVCVDRYRYAGVEEVLRGRLIVALDEVTDPRNLGAVARTALASGADAMVVGRHRAAGVTPAAVKASAGATEHLPIAQVANLRSFLLTAQKHGFWVYGAAGDARRSYLDIDYDDRLVLVLGSEGRGLRRLVAETCDELMSLPMEGPVTSLNVSVAAAVLLYEARRRATSRAEEQAEGGDLSSAAATAPAAAGNAAGPPPAPRPAGNAGPRQPDAARPPRRRPGPKGKAGPKSRPGHAGEPGGKGEPGGRGSPR